MKYLRFGVIPKKEKSINFLKMSNDQNDIFSSILSIAGYDAAMETVSAEALEDGVSVFEIKDGKPVLDNMRLMISFARRINDPAFIVEGTEAGRGNDGEPLIKGIESVSPVVFNKGEAVETLIEALRKAFHDSSCQYDRVGSDDIFPFYENGKPIFVYKGWTFADPVDGFDTSTGIKR